MFGVGDPLGDAEGDGEPLPFGDGDAVGVDVGVGLGVGLPLPVAEAEGDGAGVALKRMKHEKPCCSGHLSPDGACAKGYVTLSPGGALGVTEPTGVGDTPPGIPCCCPMGC